MISGFSSIVATRGIKATLNYSKKAGTQEVELKPLNAVSSSIMFNEIIVPITFVALAFNRSTVALIIMVVFYQFCQYRVYKGDGFMPNLTLELVGLNSRVGSIYVESKLNPGDSIYVTSPAGLFVHTYKLK